MNDPAIVIDPVITAEQLHQFYVRNGICEAGYSPERAGVVLQNPGVVVAAVAADELIGIVRAVTDGLSAAIMEFSIDVRYQTSSSRYRNGSVLESDPQGLANRLGEAMLAELRRRGVDFVSCAIVQQCEEAIYERLGFRENVGHRVFIIDDRPY